MGARILQFPRHAPPPDAEPQRWFRNLEALEGAKADARDALEQLREEGMGLDLALLGFTMAMEEASHAEWGAPLRDSMGGGRLEALWRELFRPSPTGEP